MLPAAVDLLDLTVVSDLVVCLRSKCSLLLIVPIYKKAWVTSAHLKQQTCSSKQLTFISPLWLFSPLFHSVCADTVTSLVLLKTLSHIMLAMLSWLVQNNLWPQYVKANNTEISIFLLSFAFLVKLHDTHHIIVAVLRWQVERNLSFVWLAVDRRTRFQQHLHGLRLPLPGCVVQRPHTCTSTERKHRTCPPHAWLQYIIMSVCFFTFLVSDVDSSLWLQQQRDELQVPIKGSMMQRRKPVAHTHRHTHRSLINGEAWRDK